MRASPSSTSSKEPGSTSSDRSNADLPLHSDFGHDSNDTETSNDPDIVILRVFEDDSRKFLSPGAVVTHNRPSRLLPPSDLMTSLSNPDQDYSNVQWNEITLARRASQNGHDDQLLQHYTSFVHRHLAQIHRDSLGTSMETGALTAPDVFEQQAAYFPPVRRIMFFS